jgi:putative transposase
MKRSYYELYIHLIWSTKGRENLLIVDIETSIIENIKAKCEKHCCKILAVGNTENHIHLLISMSPSTNIELFVKEAKGSTSYFINHNTDRTLYWQDGYGAISISKSGLKFVKEYVENQKKHHDTKYNIVEVLEKDVK